jgi:hypothetical protein
LGITQAGDLRLKPDDVLEEQAKGPRLSERKTFGLQLTYIATAMVPPNEKMTLSMGQRILPIAVNPSSSTTIHGFVDYITATADRSVAGEIAV